MNITLSAEEARVIGCLMEKAITTPDQYPLTLNALTNACNQKSSREPVMALQIGAVQRTTRQLEEKYLLSKKEGLKSNVEKYAQRMCNTTLGEIQFDAAEYAIVCLVLLRGPQTPGELRSRSGRLHNFSDNHAVVESLKRLMSREGGAFLARLPKKVGRQDHEYMHLFYGDLESAIEETSSSITAPNQRKDDRIAILEARVQVLETALIGLAETLGETIVLTPPEARREDSLDTES